VTLLEEQVADLNERFAAQESHFEGLRSAILELRRELLDRRDEDSGSLKRRMDELEKTVTSGLAEMHRSFQMLLDRRDVTLLQRSVNETMKRVQALEAGQLELRAGQQELRQSVQELQAGQQELRQSVQELQAGQQELRQSVQELRTGQQRIEQTLQQILAKLG
jgi:chromosome segregation ATPase